LAAPASAAAVHQGSESGLTRFDAED
jgi:hypothetical protein